ncbi:MAG: bidirectional hydrogenase complex protein HoxE [Lentisphaerae bacterium]|nr:bidirectional hydrogenase complex protein HoxE [Lentisphaerota bacterium]
MAADSSKIAAPSADKRWRLVDNVMRRHGYRADGLIESLHAVQESFGYLDDVSLRFVAASLRLPPSKVYGVATFYHFFTLKPQGEHTCVVCLGTACYIKGAQKILDRIEQDYGIKPGETTPDNKLSVLTARCIGSCGLAPAVVIDGTMSGKLTADETAEHICRCVGA